MNINFQRPPITRPQEEYLEGLLIDCMYHTRAERNAMLSHRTGREIKYITDLTCLEANRIIAELKETKEENAKSRRSNRQVED